MKYLFLIFFVFLLFGCTSSKRVYWCGDHPCLNKKEKEAYFRDTMIVEVRTLNKEDFKKNSEFEKISQQAIKREKNKLIEKKKLEKQAKLEKKRKLKEEKQIAKQAKLEEKRKLKEEKQIAKQAKLEEKRKLNEQKKLEKQSKNESFDNNIKSEIEVEEIKKIFNEEDNKNTLFELNEFDELVEEIYEKNVSRPYPDINDIPK